MTYSAWRTDSGSDFVIVSDIPLLPEQTYEINPNVSESADNNYSLLFYDNQAVNVFVSVIANENGVVFGSRSYKNGEIAK